MVQKGNHGSEWIEDITYNQQTITADAIAAAIASITTYVEESTSVTKKIVKYPENHQLH